MQAQQGVVMAQPMQAKPMLPQGQVMQGQVMPVSQGVQQMGVPPNSGKWHDGLFECLNDLPICCYGCCCTYCLFGSNAQNLNNQIGCLGQTCLAFAVDLVTVMVTGHGCSCFVTMTGRTILRNKYGLPASPCGGCLSHCCCQSCSLCQEAREIQHRNTEAQQPYVLTTCN
jgi:Cys-rich protein (TIGR01571 family)